MGNNFDSYKDKYRNEVQKSISFIKQDIDFFTEVKVRHLLEIAKRGLGNLSHLQVLDLGCGIGLTDELLVDKFEALYGVDISQGMIDKAKTINPSVNYLTYDGKTLPFLDNSLDLVFSICVLHHVSHDNWEKFICEMKRVTKIGGMVVVFEHNPFNPLTRYAVKNCEFDKDAELLKISKTEQLLKLCGLSKIEKGYILFFPFKGTVFTNIERKLEWLPLGAQYFVVGKK